MKVEIDFEVSDAFKKRCVEHGLTPQQVAEEAIYWYQSKEPSMVTEMAVKAEFQSETKVHYRLKQK